ncbi:MAG: Gfo/Idh/MocA family protein [Kiritimatiellia bacterium]|jgi:UDP-N-acetyl-2-amino-2-deoxyglucuronate dehydrogenase
MKKIVAAIVGNGVIAPTHAGGLQGLPGVEVRWACDRIREKAETLAAAYAIPRTTAEAAEVFADPEVDLVCVCTDHASHADLVCGALDAGKHVLCEKALANDSRNLRRILDAAARRPDLVASGVFQHRFDKINRALYGLVRGGALGHLLTAGVQLHCFRSDDYYRADAWRGTWALEGGAVLINQAIHFLDLFQWIAGGIETVSGMYANLAHQGSMECEDTAVAAVRFRRDGALGTITASNASSLDWQAELAFRGTHGAIVVRDDKPVQVEMAAPGESERVRAELEEAARAPAPFSTVGKTYYGGGHNAQFADVVAAIRERRAPEVTVEAAAEAVRLVFGLYESHRANRPVALPSA